MIDDFSRKVTPRKLESEADCEKLLSYYQHRAKIYCSPPIMGSDGLHFYPSGCENALDAIKETTEACSKINPKYKR